MQKLTDSTVLILSNVWPEPSSSAAGSHMMQLIRLLHQSGYFITYGSTASVSLHTSPELHQLAETCTVKMNDSSFDEFLKDLKPDIVIFDRFMVEEQFSWRVYEHAPDALRILNTEDLHGLRRFREKQIRENVFHLQTTPKELFHSDDGRRELASIYRSDLTLIISQTELNMLVDVAGVRAALLHYYPLTYGCNNQGEQFEMPQFEDRRHFMSIGNFHHPPNKDAVLFLRDEIWPLIREKLPESELHIFGAYATEAHKKWSQPGKGFLVKGRAPEVSEVMKSYRVLLAPLRFGAGLKGKLLDAMYFGLPSVTTDIGLEGITDPHLWEGWSNNSPESIARKSITLYSDSMAWRKNRSQGFEVLKNRFNASMFDRPLAERISLIKKNLYEHRMANITGGMLWHQNLMSTRYMSRWIEEKKKAKSPEIQA